MADLAIAVTAKLIEVIGSDAIKKICEMWGYKDELEELNKTIDAIKNVLLDAEAKRDDLSHAQRGYISELKDAVYDADDLFDEFRTLAELDLIGGDKGGKLFGKVRRFFSSKKEKLCQAHRMSRRVKEIKEQLDGVANNYTKFGFSVDYKPIVRRREETCSYVNKGEIIVGREEETKLVIDMLLDPNVDEDFCYVSIVGVGGSGKTAVAKLIYNDERIKEEFKDLRLWVCVSDQDGVQFDVKTILCKILESITKDKHDANSCTMQLVQHRLEKELGKNKYFLILDDIWNENHKSWLELQNYLLIGEKGSRMVVTTRSETTASTIDNHHAKTHIHKLKDLSLENSWLLFEMTAFDKLPEEYENYEIWVNIGRKIVEKCYRNPLAIKVVGSLLYGQNISKWQSIEKSGLVEIGQDNDNILPILKLSYHNLIPSLKNCFSYCAIFPKGIELEKEDLIAVWMAQEYIVPLDGGQSIEDAAEEYFLVLMRRCFFQDVKKDVYSNVKSVKIHDFMHDIAMEVAKEEICVVTSSESNLSKKIRHVTTICHRYNQTFLCHRKIRSLMCVGSEACLEDKKEENLTALRMLGLYYFSKINKSFPRFIGDLLLLRFLELCDDNFEEIPDSIARLYNLQTLILDCQKLKMLPKDFSQLINLRHLEVNKCRKLTSMAKGMNKLTKMRILPYFVVGENLDNELKVLQVFSEVKGGMCIRIMNNCNNVGGVNDVGIGYLKNMKHLTELTIEFESEGESGNYEVVLEKLEPHPNVKGLNLFDYKGTTIPWSSFSPQHHFVHISIHRCHYLERISMLSRLPHLKSLKLVELISVEYMEDEMSSTSNDAKAVAEYFPSLEYLEINNMANMKGWWKGELFGKRLRFPRLSVLKIYYSPNLSSFSLNSSPQSLPLVELPSLCTLEIWNCNGLASILICPILKLLYLSDAGETLQITCLNSQDEVVQSYANIDKVGYLNSIPLNCLTRLNVSCDWKIKSIFEVEEAFQRYSSTLKTLEISFCENLSTISGLEHLTALEELKLKCNANLIILEGDEEPWKSLHQTLRILEFYDLEELKSLPIGMRHLTSLQSLSLSKLINLKSGLPQWMSCLSSLQSLKIEYCNGIKSLSEAIKGLTSLKKLSISGCPTLGERCKKPNGLDFPKIQHIPEIIIDDNEDFLVEAVEEFSSWSIDVNINEEQ